MRIATLAAATLAAFLLGGAVPAEAGDVQGTVTLKSAVAPRAVGKKKVRGYGRSDYGEGRRAQDEGGPPPGAEVNELTYVVLYLEPASGKLPATPRTVAMRQKNKDFLPHVLPVVKGSRVVFTNEDLILHHIYSTSRTDPFEIPKYSRGKSQAQQMDHTGVVEVFCGLHPRMNAYIVVVDNDFFTMADGTGRFTLKAVPPGNYTLKAWHPRLKPVSSTVQVPATGAVKKDLSL